MAYANDIRVAGFNIAERFNGFRSALADRNAKNKIYRQTVSELSNLTNRELDDLGIHRSMIRAIATEAAYGAK